MWRYILQRCFLLVPTFIGITLISFLVMRLAPGDPAELRAGGGLAGGGELGISTEKRGAVDQALAQWRVQFGLDQPLHVQYVLWLKNLFTLNLGESFKDNQPVLGKILDRLPVTVKIEILSILLVYLVAIPLGIYSATNSYSIGDQITTLGAFVLFALPVVWAGTMAIVFLCGGDFFYLFPPGGVTSLDYSPDWPLWARVKDQAWHLFLPVLLLSYSGFAGLSRYMRTGMLEQLRQDFVITARSKGLSERAVIYKHVLRNSLIPMVTILAGILPGLIGGSVIIETIFSIPGLGQLGYEAVLARDYPTVMALFTVSALLTLIGILVSDILLAVVDPRIAFGRREQ
ncbi:MAG: ABC transporter permease [Deltaproteobacteria bacterium]|nr:ABC transporter permease [Deltaproteobacteria bacterium]